MLCLGRKLGEKIVINDNVIITVLSIDRGKVRLGVECPREIPVLREELVAGRPGRSGLRRDMEAM